MRTHNIPSCLRNRKAIPFVSSDLGLKLTLTSSNYPYLEHILGRVAQSVGHLTRKSGVLGSIPGRFSFRFFEKGSCQLLAKVSARSTG